MLWRNISMQEFDVYGLRKARYETIDLSFHSMGSTTTPFKNTVAATEPNITRQTMKF